jgi:hypothetical protein
MPRRTPLKLAAALFTFGLLGCLPEKGPIEIGQVIGPAPEDSELASSGDGSLVVFSQPVAVTTTETEQYPSGPYDLYDAHGKHLASVDNLTGQDNELQSPTPVRLAPGAYRIRAFGNGGRHFEVAVKIEPGRITTVHLDGSHEWEPSDVAGRGDLARAPDGMPVGWRW